MTNEFIEHCLCNKHFSSEEKNMDLNIFLLLWMINIIYPEFACFGGSTAFYLLMDSGKNKLCLADFFAERCRATPWSTPTPSPPPCPPRTCPAPRPCRSRAAWKRRGQTPPDAMAGRMVEWWGTAWRSWGYDNNSQERCLLVKKRAVHVCIKWLTTGSPLYIFFNLNWNMNHRMFLPVLFSVQYNK